MRDVAADELHNIDAYVEGTKEPLQLRGDTAVRLLRLLVAAAETQGGLVYPDGHRDHELALLEGHLADAYLGTLEVQRSDGNAVVGLPGVLCVAAQGEPLGGRRVIRRIDLPFVRQELDDHLAVDEEGNLLFSGSRNRAEVVTVGTGHKLHRRAGRRAVF